MAKQEIGRRSFLKGLAVMALAPAGVPVLESYAQQPEKGQVVPNSAGTNRPRLKAPPNTCDSHMHIYDPERFPFPGAPSRRPSPSGATSPAAR